jgi:hypothetical protein
VWRHAWAEGIRQGYLWHEFMALAIEEYFELRPDKPRRLRPLIIEPEA